METDRYPTYDLHYDRIELLACSIIPKLLERILGVTKPPEIDAAFTAVDLGVLLAARASTAIDREALKRSIADSEGNGK